MPCQALAPDLTGHDSLSPPRQSDHRDWRCRRPSRGGHQARAVRLRPDAVRQARLSNVRGGRKSKAQSIVQDRPVQRIDRTAPTARPSPRALRREALERQREWRYRSVGATAPASPTNLMLHPASAISPAVPRPRLPEPSVPHSDHGAGPPWGGWKSCQKVRVMNLLKYRGAEPSTLHSPTELLRCRLRSSVRHQRIV